MTVQEMLEKISELSLADRKQLMHALVDSLTDEAIVKTRKLSELRGLGAEIWKGVDAQDYVDQLRDEWDEHP